MLTAGHVVASYDAVGGVTTKIGEATVTTSMTWEFAATVSVAGAHSFTAVVENSVNNPQGLESAAYDALVQEVTIAVVTSDDGNVLAASGNTTEDDTLTGIASAEPYANEKLVIDNGSSEIAGTIVWTGITSHLPRRLHRLLVYIP